MNVGAPARVALVGNPNSGKTTLFNALTGLSARVGNYPGITVEHREGHTQLEDGTQVRVVDLPGTYSLVPRADDEAVAVRGVLGTLPQTPAPSLIVAVVDATSLERNLYTVVQLRELGLPVAVALTMMDTLESDETHLDISLLEKRLGVPVVRASSKAKDATALRAALPELLRSAAPTPGDAPTFDDSDEWTQIGETLQRELGLNGSPQRWGIWATALRTFQMHERVGLPTAVVTEMEHMAPKADQVQRSVDSRYHEIAELCVGVLQKKASVTRTRSERFTDSVDRVVLHPVAGPFMLMGIMALLFQTLFAGSAPLMDGIESLIGILASTLGPLVPDSLPLARSLLVNGVVAGVGNVVVFVPQIAVLFLFLGVLEDSGYLARAAFLLDRLMAKVGLHGRAFVPLLSGFACAVPAILATRTIESTKDRFVTILVTPLVSCSARLPVYALMISTVFATQEPVAGFLHPGVLVLTSMYLLGLGAAIGMAALFKRTLLKSPRPALVLELPPYRVPHLADVLRHTLSRVRIFLTEAGTVILALTVILWGLFTFPRSEELRVELETQKSALLAQPQAEDATAAQVADLEALFKRRSVEQSIAGRLGKGLEPIITPLGFDWKIGVGLIASFAAREVLVSTLGLVYGLGDDSDEESVPLRAAMRADVHTLTGKPVYTPLTGLSLMVFFVLAMQCMSTVAVVRRELQSWKWAGFQIVYMTALAYLGSLLTYQGGLLLGFS